MKNADEEECVLLSAPPPSPSPRSHPGGKNEEERIKGKRRWLSMARLSVAVAVVVMFTFVAAVVRFHPTPTTLVANEETDFERHFATKTVYWDQRVDAADKRLRALRLAPRTAAIPSVAATTTITSGMRLIQSQLVTRHGIRFPTLEPIIDLESLLTKLAPYQAQLPKWLHGYSLPYNQTMEGQLSASGVVEMQRFATRLLAARGRTTTRASYSTGTYQLSHTHVARTKASAMAFAGEYFENPDDVQYIEHPKHNDTLLRFFDVCVRYQQQVKHNESATHEMHAYLQSKAMASDVSQLISALGLNSSKTKALLTPADVAAAVSGCAFDIALFDTRHHWCALFTPDSIASLDYFDDLKAFYQLAGGYAINYEMAAVLLQDTVRLMDERIQGKSSLEGVFRFAHAETTLPLMTLLGFGDKKTLTAAASREEITHRGFRTSVLAPFAANIEFRLYGHEPLKDQAEYFVQVLVNERDDVVIAGCESVLCPLETLKTRLWRRFLYEYDFHTECQVEKL